MTKKYQKQEILEKLTTHLSWLHRDLLKKHSKDSFIHIEKAPIENALAWYDTETDLIYITDTLSKWSVELLYVLAYHEITHRICEGLVEHYTDTGYHTESFRKVFENISGMRTYHDDNLGWQFIEKVGEPYFQWLKENKYTLNEIFDLISKTDLSEEKQSSSEKQDSGEEELSQEEIEQSIADKMNNILKSGITQEMEWRKGVSIKVKDKTKKENFKL